jgi:hypothetical protein
MTNMGILTNSSSNYVHLSGEDTAYRSNFHPHRHGVISDGCFSQDGTLHPIPEVDTQKMMVLFRHKVFRMLLAEEKITETHVEKLLAWRHTGFSVDGGDWCQGRQSSPADISFTGLLLPRYEDMVSNIAFPVMLGELALMLWLVIKGAKVQPLAAAAS